MLIVSWRQYYRPDEPVGVPSLVMASEQYNRIMRLLGLNVEVELELEVKNTFYEQDLMSYNTLAEIPGTDRKDEVVMLGAHLDSWHVGTGATDNGVGAAVCMEVTRILKALNSQSTTDHSYCSLERGRTRSERITRLCQPALWLPS